MLCPVLMPWDIATLVITSIIVFVVIFVAFFVIVAVYKNIWRADADIYPSLLSLR